MAGGASLWRWVGGAQCDGGECWMVVRMSDGRQDWCDKQWERLKGP